MVTDRTPDFQILGAPTQGVCLRCFIDLGMTIAQALQTAWEEQQALQAVYEADSAPEPEAEVLVSPDSVGAEPGVLEKVEADEGLAHAPVSSASAKRFRKRTDQEQVTAVPEEVETSDVNR